MGFRKPDANGFIARQGLLTNPLGLYRGSMGIMEKAMETTIKDSGLRCFWGY